MLQVIAFLLRGLYALISKFFGSIFSRLWIFILSLAPELVKKLLVYLGVGLASYTGSDYLIAKLTSFLSQSLDSVPADILIILQLCKFDKGLAIFASALTIAVAIKSMSKTVHLVKSSEA